MSVNTLAKKNKIKWYLLGPFVSICGILVLLCIETIMLSEEFMPASVADEFAIASIFLGTAVGGVAAAKRKGDGVLTSGAATGAAVLLIILLTIMLRPQGNLISEDTLKTAVCSLGGGLIGGAACMKKRTLGKKNKNYRKHG